MTNPHSGGILIPPSEGWAVDTDDLEYFMEKESAMKQRDAGRALKRAIARRKLEDPTWEPKVPSHPEREHWAATTPTPLSAYFPPSGIESLDEMDALRDELKAQLREESARIDSQVVEAMKSAEFGEVPKGWCGGVPHGFLIGTSELREESGPGWNVAKPGDTVEVLSGDLDGFHFVVREVHPDGPAPEVADDQQISGWGWLLAILACLLAWGALIVLLMCIWVAVKHG